MAKSYRDPEIEIEIAVLKKEYNLVGAKIHRFTEYVIKNWKV